MFDTRSANVDWLLHDRDGTALDAGRRTRYATTRQRRAARDRDRCRCRFPGCEARRVDLHHIRHWDAAYAENQARQQQDQPEHVQSAGQFSRPGY